MDFSDEIVDEIYKIFQVEAEEIISKLNNSLLALEKNPHNKDAILMLFRDAHTLKGASRMVGFNSIQTVAHKMEDILGLAKDNKIQLNEKTVDILYKTVDFLSELIEKSVEKEQDIYNEKLSAQIALLENIMEYTDEISPLDEQIDFDAELFIQNIYKINDLIAENLFILMKIEMENNSELISKFLQSSKELYEIFSQIGFFEIKKEAEDIKVKLEFISKASNSLTNNEIDEIHQTIDSIIEKLIPLCEIYNLPLVDYYELAFSKTSQQSGTKPLVEAKIESEIVKDEAYYNLQNQIKATEEETVSYCNDLSATLTKLSELENNECSTLDVKAFLENFEKSSINEDLRVIFERIIKVFDFAAKNEMKLDDETISVIKHSIEFCDNVMKNQEDAADKDLIVQRLDIIQQVLEFKIKKEEEHSLVAKSKQKSKSVADFSEIFSSSEIKTLRVDSSKLDTLVNQINELMINKIKTKKHLLELNEINKEMEEWQRDSIKALNYLKYYDKKYFQSGVKDNPVSFFIRQLLTLFSENNKKVQETISNISTLYRTIQEDDLKLNLVVDDLEHMVKNIRVLPLATVFHLFGRMVRDIAVEKGKRIELEIQGSETSTDKKIIEEIKAPLIHIIRNAIDHGIETPEERTSMGKPPAGKILLAAKQVGNKVIIEITDDGRGINLEKIKEKAIQKGFLTKEEIDSMTNEQITNIIFSPGFSTGDEITDISGRGIGLDVVQTKIAQLNGRVKVLSEINEGCCVQIELPTTMSTLKSFLVKSAGQTFAIPMDTINTVMRKRADEIILNKGKRSIIFEEKTIPLYDLSDILKQEKIQQKPKDRETVLILESDDKIIALSVDKLLGDQELLHKKLSAPLYKLKNISGITTLVSGEICLILNISDIIKSTKNLSSKKSAITTQDIIPNSNYKILLVDDSITTRTMEKNILSKIGYDIETAENPIEAFDKMKLSRFDLIISDIEMPEMDGLEFLEKLKTNEMYFDIPVIMVSSLATDENKQKAMDLGAKKYIVKNEFSQDDFQETVSKILRKEI